jgi:hypothetical protein
MEMKNSIAYGKKFSRFYQPFYIFFYLPLLLIGKIGEKLWAAVYTRRNNAIRVISVRRARKKEARFYEQKEIS